MKIAHNTTLKLIVCFKKKQWYKQYSDYLTIIIMLITFWRIDPFFIQLKPGVVLNTQYVSLHFYAYYRHDCRNILNIECKLAYQ